MNAVTTPPGLASEIVEQAPDALVLVDSRGTVVFANGAVGALFGYRPAELVGQDIELLVPERSRGVHTRLRGGFAVAPETREMGARMVALAGRRKDGSEFPAEIRLAPIMSGTARYVLAAVRDVTDRRRISDALDAARAEADSANKAKSRFLATASHDLRQPLQSLQLLNAALLRRTQDDGLRDLLGRQQAALESMGDLLNSLLDVTRLESGALQPTFAVVAVSQILADLRGQFEAIASARGLSLSVATTDACVRTDRVLFRQLLQNLLNNAMKFTRDGGVTVRVDRDADDLRIAVADTGIGIADAHLARIFDEYYRIDTPGMETRGFGLGLTIVRQIARLLGFQVAVDSEPGKGTTFTVRVPAAHVAAGAQEAEEVGALVPVPAGSTKPGLLVVEDDAPVREAIALLLGSEGYGVRTAASADEAEALFANIGEEVDVVVSDYQLGAGRTGADLVAALRSVASRDLPVVILSGDTTSALEAVRSLPRSMLLRKPVDATRLVAAIEQLFGGE